MDQRLSVTIRLNKLDSAYFELGDEKQAKAYFEADYQIFLKFFGLDHTSKKITAE